jgi:hypothetical protein
MKPKDPFMMPFVSLSKQLKINKSFMEEVMLKFKWLFNVNKQQAKLKANKP